MRYAWLGLGAGSVLVALIAVALPLVPSTPFLLVAAFAFARSSDRLHTWLHEHPRLGPPLADWNNGRLVRRSAKRLATISIALAFGVSVALGLKPWILVVQAVVLTSVVAYIWTRPEPDPVG
ncbi:MAG: YbaN family protein [Candidatus Nanopelagicales bacterium]